jgi:hypothetical protein
MTALRITPSVVADVLPEQFVIKPAPIREPPFDDELPAADSTWVHPIQRPLPFLPVHPPVPPRAAPVPQSRRRAAVPDPGLWTRRLLIGIIESAAGQRPLSQLTPMLSTSVAFGLGEDLRGTSPKRQWLRTARIGSVRSTEPIDGVAELCATLRTPRQTHAVAVRLEIRRDRWICTRLVVG